MSCKHKGRCVCGKEEYYLFTPHLTDKEEKEIYPEWLTIVDSAPNNTDNIVDYGYYRIKGEEDIILVDRLWGIVEMKFGKVSNTVNYHKSKALWSL